MTPLITLPAPTHASDMRLAAAIHDRRTVREYTDDALTLPQLSQLLWAAGGRRGDDGKRTVPSAGGEYPLTLYGAIGAVADISSGLYRYQVDSHSLETVAAADVRESLAAAVLDEQPWVENAAAIIAITADLPRMNAHFGQQPPEGQRGTRYSYIETGAAAQNVHLQATALGLGMVLVAGFDDHAVSRALSLPAHLSPTALLCLGHPAAD